MRFFWMFCFLILYSCKQFFPQKPQINSEELPDNCTELHHFIQNNWKKHRSNPCHAEVPNAFVLATRFKSCFEQLNRNQIERLLGQPDKIEFGIYFYFMKKDCRNMSPNGSYYLEVAFKGDMVRQVNSTYREIIE